MKHTEQNPEEGKYNEQLQIKKPGGNQEEEQEETQERVRRQQTTGSKNQQQEQYAQKTLIDNKTTMNSKGPTEKKIKTTKHQRASTS